MATDAYILKESALLSMRALKSLFTLIQEIITILVLPFRGRRKVSSHQVEKDEKRHDCHRKGTVVRVPAKMVPWKNSISISSNGGGGGGGGGAAVKVVDQVVMVRREMAVRRVMEENDDESCVREYWLLGTRRGDTIFTQSWTPVSVQISGRYSDFAKQLNANGYKVYGMDWVGHGGSDGLHGYVHCLDDAVSDMALLDPKVEAKIVGAAFTSPAVGVEPSHPILLVLAPILSFLLPRYQWRSAYKKGLPVSRDPQALIAKYSDPLVCTGPLRVRTGYEILRITGYLQQNFRKLRVPFFVLHGTADCITEPEASKKMYEQASSCNKSIKLYEGFSHDLLFEPERDVIARDIIRWVNSRM
ncbi:hypothetical protein TanjilG_02116 [Lupinus angustifolius]|uniref:Serine aminopeptidase S33 domain-containing protein n=1 Tax=Lupinus angustifolius TaxID=3871 RepID=A0A394D9E7_LUPAN|nr:hypothetical protein TanjilG_02116 [Lupinus angustifolius]